MTAPDESLGDITLPDDGEAFAFGRTIIRELMHRHAQQYVGSGARTVTDYRAGEDFIAEQLGQVDL